MHGSLPNTGGSEDMDGGNCEKEDEVGSVTEGVVGVARGAMGRREQKDHLHRRGPALPLVSRLET